MSVLAGCAQSGSMVVDGPGAGGRVTYSKYFDGADWLIADKLGASVVIDNDTPVSQQVFGGFTGKDSDAVGTVTVYFWNLERATRKTSLIRVRHENSTLENKTEFTIGPGPFARTKHPAGVVPFFAYATNLKVKLTIEIDGQIIERDINAERRTSAELKKYFGEGGTPPYPWFDPKYGKK